MVLVSQSFPIREAGASVQLASLEFLGGLVRICPLTELESTRVRNGYPKRALAQPSITGLVACILTCMKSFLLPLPQFY